MTFAFNALGECLRQFRDAEDGIVTTDWIILTGAIMGAALAGVTSVRTGVADLALDVEGSLSASSVATLRILPELAEPLYWVESYSNAIAGTKCPPAPALCPNFSPPTVWDYHVLELADGTKVERVTTTEWPDNPDRETQVVHWRDMDGNNIDGPLDPPVIDKKTFATCDKWGNCSR